MKRRGSGATLITVFAVLVVGRQSPAADTAEGREGVRYFLPRSVVSLKATKTTTTAVGPAADLSKVTTEIAADVAYEVSVHAVADGEISYSLSDQPSFWKAKDTEIKVSPAGLLEGVNADSKGQAGPILMSILRGLSSLAAVVVAADKSGPTPAAETPLPPPVDRCKNEAVNGVDRDLQAYIKRTPEGCTLWRGLKASEQDVAEWQQRLANARVALERATPAGFDRALAVVREHRAEVDLLSETRDSLQKQMQAGLKAFRGNYHFRSEKTTEVRLFDFSLADLPSDDEVASVIANAAALAPPKQYVAMTALVRWAGLAISRDVTAVGAGTAPLASTGTESTVADKAATGASATSATAPKDTHACATASREDIVLRYRRPRSVRLTAWRGDPGKSAQPDQVTVASAFAAGDPVYCLRLPSSAWSDRHLEAAFDSGGQPLRVKTSSTASGTAVGAAVASAVSEAAGAYKSSLEQLLAAKKARGALSSEDLAEQLADLKAKKDVVDARVALKGSEATSEDRAQVQEIGAQIERLKAETSLAQAEQTQELKISIEVLKAQVEQLNQQLALLKAKSELEKK